MYPAEQILYGRKHSTVQIPWLCCAKVCGVTHVSEFTAGLIITFSNANTGVNFSQSLHILLTVYGLKFS